MYIFLFITKEQYAKLCNVDRKLKVRNLSKWSRLKIEAEHRLEFGCKICGWKGTRARK